MSRGASPRPRGTATRRRAPTALVALLLSACGGHGDRVPVSARVLYPAEKGDLGYLDGVSAGVSFARFTLDVALDERMEPDVDRAREVLDGWLADAPERPRLVILAGARFAPLVAERGCDLGPSRVLLLDAVAAPCPELRSVVHQTFAPAFQAGVAAVALAPAGRVAAVTGAPALPRRFADTLAGFRAGVAHAGGTWLGTRDVHPTDAGFDDGDAARAAARALLEDGAEVLLALAGRSDPGVVDAVRAAPGDGALVIGGSSDLVSEGGPLVPGSVLPRVERTVADTLAATARDAFTAGSFFPGLAEGNVIFALNPRFETRLANVVSGAREAALAAEAAYRAGPEPAAEPTGQSHTRIRHGT